MKIKIELSEDLDELAGQLEFLSDRFSSVRSLIDIISNCNHVIKDQCDFKIPVIDLAVSKVKEVFKDHIVGDENE